MNCTLIQIVAIAFFLLQPTVLFPMKISPDKAGKGDQTLPLHVETYQTDGGSEKEVGTDEIKKPAGREDKVYHSIASPEEEAERRQEEKKKVEKSLDMLRNIIIIPKRTQ